MPSQIQLHVYDLSSGMAATLSKSLLGQEFKAIYHTGVVVYGIEYFYGDGISTGHPGATQYGTPIRKEDKGETTKTLQEIQQWVNANSEFVGDKYNPMSHNCNHFSNAFLQFLNGQSVAAEILEQPNDFMSTSIGQMVGGMFGLGNKVQQIEKEQISDNYKSLYIEDPKVFVADEAHLITVIKQTNKSAKFVDQLNRVLNAYNDKKDYKIEKDVAQELESLDINDTLFDILALICTTTSVTLIPADLKPFSLLDKQSNSAAFLKYLNNWFTSEIGMLDCREHVVEYSGFLRHLINTEQNEVQLNATRCYYSLCRVLTFQNIKQTTPLPYLSQIYKKYLESMSSNGKHFLTCLNLVCGVIGRVLLTIKQRDITMYNQAKIQLQQDLDFSTFAETKAPCVKDLIVLVGKSQVSKNDEDDMF